METNREIDDLRDAVKKQAINHNELVEMMNGIGQDLKLVKMAVVGSEQLGFEGAIKKIERHDKYILADKKQKWMIAGGVTVISFLITLISVFKK